MTENDDNLVNVVAKETPTIMEKDERSWITMKVDKKVVLTGLSAIFGAGAFIIDVISQKNDTKDAAEEAAKIVMEQIQKAKK